MNGKFVLNEDKERGIKTIGWFEPDGRITVQVQQWVPDEFFASVKAMRDAQTAKAPNTQDHWRLVGVIPQALQDKLLVDSDGKPLEYANPDRDKKLRQILNSNEYSHLRVAGGHV